MQDARIRHANMVRDVVAGLREVLQQEQSPIKTPASVHEPQEHVEKSVHITQHQLAAQIQ